MLYLNRQVTTDINAYGGNLTLTSVVFEYMAQQICVNFGQNLTLTSVVFE